MKDIAVEYLGGSGFLVTIGETGFLFDASEHGPDKRILPEKDVLRGYRKLYVFVSHRHSDHFSETIYDLCGEDAVYIVGFDLPQPHRGVRMNPGETQGFGSVQVKAFGSTDEGVSFLVEYAGISIFHAGDLNLWHWRQESTLREIEAAEAAFYKAVEPIRSYHIDVCMFPVDPRQGMMYDAGANHFILTMKPRVFIPMHWQDRPEVAIEYARRTRNPQTEVVALTKAGTIANLTFSEEVLDIHIIEPPKDLDDQLYPQRKLGGSGIDPFADTDLPVQL